MPLKRVFNLLLAVALLLLGIADVVYLLVYAKEITFVMLASAVVTLGIGGFWLYSEIAAAAPSADNK
jgi:hypothetical protein